MCAGCCRYSIHNQNVPQKVVASRLVQVLYCAAVKSPIVHFLRWTSDLRIQRRKSQAKRESVGSVGSR